MKRKQFEERLEEIANAVALDKKTSKSDLKSIAHTFRMLADEFNALGNAQEDPNAYYKVTLSST